MRGTSRDRRPPVRRAAALPAVAALAVLGVVGIVLGFALAPPGRPGEGVTATSRSQSSSPALASSPAGTPTVRPVPKHEVFGFVPYWEMDAGIAEHLAKTELTTLALFSVTPTRDGTMAMNERGYRAIDGELGRRLLREAHERGTRVELTFTSFGAERNRRFFDDTAAQTGWIATLVDYAATRGFDGVNVDVEGLPVDLVPAYGSFVGRLRDALRARIPDAQVSVATGAHALGAAMAAAAAGAGADRVFLMGYDYRTAGSEPGATAPLERVYGDGGDLATSLDLYAAVGVPVSRTILGLPLYGLTWTALSPEEGGSAAGRGDVWVPRRNLDALADPSFVPLYVPTESVEFVATPARDGQFTAVYYDSPRSLRPKLALADERGLAGAGFWAIGYERGVPGYTGLIAEFRSGRLGQ